MILIALLFLLGCKKEQAIKNDTLVPPAASPQSLTPRMISLSPHCKGFYEYLPQGYSTDAPGTTYPLMIFLHGGGETGEGALDKLLINGPLKLISDSTFPASFTVNNKTYKFIIIAPQFTSSGDPFSEELDAIIEYTKQNYKVDVSRIYLTGLSFGGGVCWNYVGNSSSYAAKIAAMVPIAAYINETREEFKITAAKAQTIASSRLPIWSTHNRNDETCPLPWVTSAYDLLKNSNPPLNPQPRLTVFNVSGHGGWTKTYDPSFKENNRNIYEWMLQYHR